MTFSIAGYCDRTGMSGVAISSSSICVASRCPWVRAGVGAVSTQNVTDPSLGPRLLDYLEAGMSPVEALSRLKHEADFMEYRQLLVVDTSGRVADFSGQQILGINAVSHGDQCIAAGNLLANEEVPAAMTQSFAESSDQHLGERLLLALRAGLAAGGEAGEVHSAGLKVADQTSWPLIDLRVDWSDADPINELYATWQAYESQMDDYITRALDPTAAPSYGVPGDP